MSAIARAVRNGLVAGVVAGLVAGLLRRDTGAAMTMAVVAAGVACAGSYLLGGSVEDEVEPQPVEFDG